MAIKNPAQAAAVILAGKDFGLSAMQSLRSLNIVEGKIGMNADFMLGLMIVRGVRHEWLEISDKVATIRLERPGFKPLTLSYTYAMADRAGLTAGYKSGAKSNYVKHTEAMLRARCVSAAARAYAPDIMGGLYLHEELDQRTPPPEPPGGGDFAEFTPVAPAAVAEVVDQATGEVHEKPPEVKAAPTKGYQVTEVGTALVPAEPLKPVRKSKGDRMLDAAAHCLAVLRAEEAKHRAALSVGAMLAADRLADEAAQARAAWAQAAGLSEEACWAYHLLLDRNAP